MVTGRISRRWFLLASFAASGLMRGGAAHAQESGRNVADLRDQLEKGLRARRPEEFRFIQRVVEMVNQGQLPLGLVKSTFQWARKKADVKRYPYQYFERGLRLRAAKLGILI